MKRIPLTQGQFALVDDEDFERMSQWNWYAWWCKDTSSFYAMRRTSVTLGKSRIVSMHREVMCASSLDEIDHRNHNTLDNRKSRLRMCTRTQNLANARVRSDNTSGYKGVSWYSPTGKWRARIHWNGNPKFLGYFAKASDAARAYDVAAMRLFSEFALTNRKMGLL
jgi:hypothetical protein